MELRLSQTDMGSSSIVNTQLNSDKIKIKVIPLLELLKKEGINKVDVLKIDIEGFEDRALIPYFKNLDKSFTLDLFLWKTVAKRIEKKIFWSGYLLMVTGF